MELSHSTSFDFELNKNKLIERSAMKFISEYQNNNKNISKIQKTSNNQNLKISNNTYILNFNNLKLLEKIESHKNCKLKLKDSSIQLQQSVDNSSDTNSLTSSDDYDFYDDYDARDLNSIKN